jgi:hypothetical protein
VSLPNPDPVAEGQSRNADWPPTTQPGPTEPQSKTAKRGRPTSFDDSERRDFCTMITLGCSARAAAGHLGFDRKTIAYARRHSPEFDAEVRLAEQSRNLAALRNVVAAGQRSWRASAWLLRSVQPELYDARRRRHGPGPTASMSKQRLKAVITEVVKEILPALLNEQGKSQNAKAHKPPLAESSTFISPTQTIHSQSPPTSPG